MDCYRAVNCISERNDVNQDVIGAMGVGQGGGLSLATAAFNKKIKMAMAGFPLLCDFERAANMAVQGPYLEIADYLRNHPEQEESVFRTFSYFDVMNLAPFVQVPTLISIGLIDTVTPPSTVFAAYNWLAARGKELAIYPAVAHEDTTNSVARRMRWAGTHFTG
jgi:cephalosporin-C deacetylase